MKKTFLFVLFCFIILITHSQNIVKEHYTATGGLSGAANFSQFRVTGDNPSNIDYTFKTGWSAGGWVNFPVSKGFSLEPQLMYSSYGYHTRSEASPILLKDGKIRYISVPLFLKFYTGDKFAITAGPQLDFFSSFEDDNNNAVETDFKKTYFSAFGGFELFPHERVSLFGRYIFGFSNMDNSTTHGDATKYKNQNIQAGLKVRLFGKKIPADSDGDGIIDSKDKCPGQVGTVKYNGCPIPDTDADGINDEEDKCPDVAGTAKYNGCPIPDTDKDGINDEQDKCPNEPGTAKYNGCPIPDTDKDGINDEQDKCPDVAGTAKNNGCPEVAEVPAEVSKLLSSSAQSVSFISNSAKLSSTNYTSLNRIVKVLNDYPAMKVKVEGHTDNTEKDADNKLSEGRASAVKTYLVSKGIGADRIDVEGFGSTMPIGDNNTATGRMKNRRVEIKVIY